MPRVLFREEWCKSCGLCIPVCPTLAILDSGNILELFNFLGDFHGIGGIFRLYDEDII